jgi:RNase P/RNase MRP subunit p29
MSYNPEEFIGCEITITNSNNKSQIGIKGTIINETKKTFTIQTNKQEKSKKTIIKQSCTFIINGKTMNGNDIAQRPEERIKKR